MPTMSVSKRVDGELDTYMKQIHPYRGIVYAEIVYNNPKTERDPFFRDSWYSTSSKSFGSMWRSCPREIDFINAHKWCDAQLALLSKYGTVKVAKARIINELEKQRENERHNEK